MASYLHFQLWSSVFSGLWDTLISLEKKEIKKDHKNIFKEWTPQIGKEALFLLSVCCLLWGPNAHRLLAMTRWHRYSLRGEGRPLALSLSFVLPVGLFLSSPLYLHLHLCFHLYLFLSIPTTLHLPTSSTCPNGLPQRTQGVYSAHWYGVRPLDAWWRPSPCSPVEYQSWQRPAA